MGKKFENNKYKIEYFPNEKVVDIFMKDEEIEKIDVIEMHAHVLELTGKEKYAILFHAKDFFSLSSEAREEGTKSHYSDNVIAQAFLVKNFAQRLIGNFIINFNRPHTDTRMFSSYDEAKLWLSAKIGSYTKKKSTKLINV